MHLLYIIEFIVVQIFILYYFRNLIKNELTPGSISAFGGLFLLECVIIYNLITKNSMLLMLKTLIN